MDQIKKFSDAPTCHCCNRTAGMETNHRNGGKYWACNRCGFTWSGDTGRLNAKQRFVSLRANTVLKLMAIGVAANSNEASEMIDCLGLEYTAKQVA